MRRFPWVHLLTIALGIALGLLYAWVIAPAALSGSSPAALRPDFRDEFRLAIASAYTATGDLARARARMALLADDDPIQALAAQAQRMLASGQPFEQARQLALLASDLQAGISSVAAAPATPAIDLSAGSPPVSSATPDMTSTVAILTASPAGPPLTLLPSATRIAIITRTPPPTRAAPFQLTARQDVCDPARPPGLLQVNILDRSGRPLGGVEITVTWSQGEDRFFTGFQPEIGEGYADYAMQPGVTYALRVARSGAPLSGITAPACPDSQGAYGGIELTFQEP